MLLRALMCAATIIALVPQHVRSQQPPPRTVVAPPTPDSAARASRDTVHQDSVPAARRRTAADTIKQVIVRPPVPLSRDAGGARWHWTRDELFASGALTLGELLSVVPGVTWLTTGFISAPQVVAWYGDVGRTRFLVDGVELDALNVRNGSVLDLSAIPLWAFEDVQVERAGGELRVHLRTWNVERTTPSTRVDVLTGSENLNLYRGFFGRRLGNGAVIQVAGQQYSTLSRGGADGDALSALARLGWAGHGWSIDATYLRSGGTRNAGFRYLTSTPVANALPPFKGSESMAYLRLGWRDPSQSGPWAQLIASSTKSGESSSSSTATALTTTTAVPGDSVDTTRARTQYVASVGANVGNLRLTATGRFRPVSGALNVAPSARVEYEAGWLGIGAYGERSMDSTIRSDVQLRLTPASWLHLSGAASHAAPSGGGVALTTLRAEAALQLRGRWISGGFVSRSQSSLSAPIEIDTALRSVVTPAVTGLTLSVRAPLVAGWSLDVDAVNWDAAGAYRPQTQARSTLRFESSFLKKLPRGNFHLLVAGTLEYRSTTFVPKGTNPLGQSTPGASALSSLLEMRIGTATISWQARNLAGQIYETYPGFVMPRISNIYGVRWEFWN